jgi:putative transposase/transposase-like zinc-binding protein
MTAHAHPLGGRATDRPRLEVADIVRAHGEAFVRAHVLLPEQHAVLRDIARCRTAALGGYVDVCAACGHAEVGYPSCRNRNCPKCQSLEQARWVERRMERMLPTHSFHVVFTLPSELRALAMRNREAVFDMLFAAASETLLELGRDPKWLGAQLGVTSVLHTWTRDLRFHPHVHCIVTGGGLSLDGERWVSTRPEFLLPVRVLGALFRGKLLARLQKAYDRGELSLDDAVVSLAQRPVFNRLRDKLYRTRWIVYAKPPFGGVEHAVRYLGHYTHRVGISNHRLLSFDERGVTFRTRGDGRATLSPDEFLRRLVQHVLPPGFVKIRHHGLFAASNVSTKLVAARRLLQGAATTPTDMSRTPRDFRELLLALTGIDVRRCPRCDVGAMIRGPLDPAVLARAALPPPDTS